VATRDDAARRLKLIISANGSSLLNEADALRGLLLRGQSDAPQELRALMSVAEKGAVAHLIKWSKAPPHERPTYVQMRDRIAQKFGSGGVMPEELARWALDAWVAALPTLAPHATATVQAPLALEAIAEPPAPVPAPPPPVTAKAPSAEPVYRNALLAPVGAKMEEIAPPPSEAATTAMPTDSRRVPMLRGLSWIAEGWRLFKAQPLMWWVCLIVFVVVSVVPQLIPIIGPIIGLLLAPILVAGLMLGAHDVQEGRPLTVGHVFAGFQTNPGALILTAVIQVGLIIAIGAAIFFLMGQRLMSAAMAWNMEKGNVDFSTIVSLLGPALPLMLLLMLVAMTTYFAPPLVAIRNEGPVRAVWLSVTGMVKNVLPGLALSVVMFILAVLATLPFGLGWIVLLPVLALSSYAAFRDIYLEAE
jgi:uncharacterized membrane protein